MTTTVIKIKGANAPAGLPVINVSPDEYAIINMPSLIEWFRADVGISGSTAADFRWTGRKSGYQLQPARTGAPTVSSALQNGKPAVLISGASDLYNAGDNALWPVGSDYTITIVARVAAGDNGAFLGNMAATDYGYLQMASPAGTLFTKHKSTGATEATSAGTTYPGAALFLMLVSYDYATKSLRQIINRTDSILKTGGVADITNSQLRIGAAGSLAVNYGALDDGGAVAEILTFNKALHKPEYAYQLALVQDYLATRYAI